MSQINREGLIERVHGLLQEIAIAKDAEAIVLKLLHLQRAELNQNCFYTSFLIRLHITLLTLQAWVWQGCMMVVRGNVQTIYLFINCFACVR